MKENGFLMYTAGDGPARDSLTAATLQAGHLDHQARQAESGLIVMAGPFGRNDERWRGLLLHHCDTAEEVEGYLLQDPLVKAGRLKYTIAPWYGAVGTKLPRPPHHPTTTLPMVWPDARAIIASMRCTAS
jgi:uncharacterized protein YciI